MSIEPRKIIAECLAEEGLSQSRFAEEIGIHRVTLTRYLGGQNDLSGTALMRAFELLGFDLVPSGRGRTKMLQTRRESVKSTQAYAAVQNLVLALNGKMTWYPKGRGGEWSIEAQGRRLIVQVPQIAEANPLDKLYKPKPDVDQPTHTEQYSNELRDDALELLRQMLNQNGEQIIS